MQGPWPSVRGFFLDRGDAMGTEFFPPSEAPGETATFVPLIEEDLAEKLEVWQQQGMPMRAQDIPWQIEPATVATFDQRDRWFLGDLLIYKTPEGVKVHLLLNARRLHEGSDLSQEVEARARECYAAIRHYYRVLGPMREHPLVIVRISC